MIDRRSFRFIPRGLLSLFRILGIIFVGIHMKCLLVGDLFNNISLEFIHILEKRLNQKLS